MAPLTPLTSLITLGACFAPSQEKLLPQTCHSTSSSGCALNTLSSAFHCQCLMGVVRHRGHSCSLCPGPCPGPQHFGLNWTEFPLESIPFARLPGPSSPLQSDVYVSPLNLWPFRHSQKRLLKTTERREDEIHGENSMFGRMS